MTTSIMSLRRWQDERDAIGKVGGANQIMGMRSVSFVATRLNKTWKPGDFVK